MKISTRIRLSALAAVLIALVAAVVLYLGARAVETALERNDRVAESLNQIFEISMLTTDYLVHYEPRAERQWRERHAELAPVLDALDVEEPEDRALVDRIRENQDEAFRLFDEITVAHAQGEQGVVDPVVSREYEGRLTARLLIVMQSMVSDAVTLGDRSSEAARLAQQRTFLLVLVLSLVGVTVMIGIGWSTTHTVIRPLVTLRDSVRQVGLGKLDTRSGVRSADEVGELATAFDGMVADLQESYAMLEREVAERTSAQHELAQYRDHLEQLVEVRTSELVTVNED
ncbi:MAG TPA: HAMP domain-containing protein, partial [Coriobacteriia bacterium]|nr:HAMP domain-containing protein [Coriobacteriia bacterium]